MKYPIALLITLSILTLSGIGCEETDDVSQPLSVVEGAGCLSTLPAGFPYQPGCCAHQVHVPAEVTEAGFTSAEIGANPTPDHVHLSWPGPTSSTVAVSWRTDRDTKATELLYGESESAVAAATGPTAEVQLVTGHHLLYGSALDGDNLTRQHEVHLCGLSPATTYFYKVGGPGAFSDTYQLSTGPVSGSTGSFSFGVAGDSRDNPGVFAQVIEAFDQGGVDFMLFTGDAVNLGQSQTQWNAWFEASTGSFAVADFLARTPLMLVNGNHENLSIGYVAQFAMPQHIAQNELADGEEWYSFDYGNAHFVALNDTPEASGVGLSMLDWLEADLAAVDRSQTPWIFVMHHRSLYCCGGSHGSNLELRQAWQPIFDRHRVDVVLSGHDHLYERSWPMRGLSGSEGEVAEATAEGLPVAESGTLYIVTAGAGAGLYGTDDSCAHTYLTESVFHFVIFRIEDRTLHITVSRLDGTAIEQLSYSK